MQAITANLLMLGAPPEALRSQRTFRHCEPDSASKVLNAVATGHFWHPDVLVIDSIGELLPLFETDSNSADEYTATTNRILSPFNNTDTAPSY